MRKKLIYFAGGLVTRTLLHPRAQKSRTCRRIYRSLYFLGKRILESKTKDFMCALVKPKMTVLDIGANIGFYSLLFSKWTNEDGKVFAFEPDPFSFQILIENLNKNNISNVTAVNCAVSDRSGVIDFFLNSENRADNRVFKSERAVEKVSVFSTTIDDYFSDKTTSVDFIKMDIQGAEMGALQGMKNLLKRNPHVIMVTEFAPWLLRSSGSDPVQYLYALASLGFRIYELTKLGSRIVEAEFSDFASRFQDGVFTDLVLRQK